ncbi:ArsR/SmtB family transcription factor [Roseitranquillus sediminis]|uniref:ArsR/SmtB family transcription factor n=1 Tax=Roseitranquillus sediminis TaxID=2809051 RepID=UPI001D0CCDAF|nr:metalloregulator ArsR/SmtB family transcription factor [Roseitranquillus sediminis]MBM9596148.1 helix-turn-helix transcriptional regulator [Roseitranquillus sediminis]
MSHPLRRPEAAAPVFAALGDPTRLTLVQALADGQDRTLGDLSQGLTMTRQAVTKHLRVLEAAGVVTSRRAGRETRFELRPERIGEMRDCLDEIGRQWEHALQRLKMHLER